MDRQLVGADGDKPVFGPVKSHAGNRAIPLPQVIADTLAAHIAKFGTGLEGLIFTNTEGRPLRRNSFSSVWTKARDRAELPDVVFHDLRHFYASLLIARGCSVKSVQTRLGHESAMVTLDTYGHLWPDSDDETRDAVDDVLGHRAEYQLSTKSTG